MFNAIFTEIRKINIFGREMQFEKDYNNRFNSIQSFVLSLIVFISVIAFTFIVGEEIYKKQKPKLTSSTLKIEGDDAQFTTLDFPLLMGFSTPNYLPLSDSELSMYLDISVLQSEVTTEGVKFTTTKFVECNIDSIENIEYKKIISDRIKSLGVYKQYCLDPNLRVKNRLGLPNSNIIEISFTKCKKNCIPNLDKALEGFITGLNYINSYIDPSDFSNPIKYIDQSEVITFSSRISKKLIFQFTKNILRTNKGWIFEDIEVKRFISFKSILNEFFFDDSLLLKVIIESPLTVNLDVREYLKIQELIANIGGFFNALILSFNFIFGHYLKFGYYKYIDDKTRYISKVNSKVDNKEKNLNLMNIKLNNFVENQNAEFNKDEYKNSRKEVRKEQILKNNQINNDFKRQNSSLENKKNDLEEIDEVGNVKNNNKKETKSNDLINNLQEKIEKKSPQNQCNQRKNSKLVKSTYDKRDSKRSYFEKENKSNVKSKKEEMKIDFENSKINIIKKDDQIENSNQEFETEYYLEFLYHNYICCRNYNSRIYKMVDKILSFDGFLKRTSTNL